MIHLFFKRKNDQSNVTSLRIISPNNLNKDQSASIYRIESTTKTDFNVDACHWFIGDTKSFSSPFACDQKVFDTEKESVRFIAKKFKKLVKLTQTSLTSSDELVGKNTDTSFSYPSWLDLEFDHEKIKKTIH